MKTIVLIPSYEPTKRLEELVNELKKEKLEIIVVNDGSDIKYNYIFKSISRYAKIINHSTNKGKGIALKTGLKYIKENYNGKYIVITMDSDGQHKVKDSLKLRDYILNNVDSLVLGKRKRNKETPFKSKFGNFLISFFYKKATKINIYDTQTGLRAFSNNLIDFMINTPGNRFEYEMNVLLMCAYNKINIKEIEIDTIYINNNSGTHFKALKDSFIILKQVIKFKKM